MISGSDLMIKANLVAASHLTSKLLAHKAHNTPSSLKGGGNAISSQLLLRNSKTSGFPCDSKTWMAQLLCQTQRQMGHLGTHARFPQASQMTPPESSSQKSGKANATSHISLNLYIVGKRTGLSCCLHFLTGMPTSGHMMGPLNCSTGLSGIGYFTFGGTPSSSSIIKTSLPSLQMGGNCQCTKTIFLFPSTSFSTIDMCRRLPSGRSRPTPPVCDSAYAWKDLMASFTWSHQVTVDRSMSDCCNAISSTPESAPSS